MNWLLTDRQGSVRDVALVGADGDSTTLTITDHLTYDGFGQISWQSSATDQPRFGYDGMRYDPATDLNLTPNRPYDPGAGNWLKPDPIGFLGGQTNTNEFCGNGPTNGTDPSGLLEDCGWALPSWSDFWFYETNPTKMDKDLQRDQKIAYGVSKVSLAAAAGLAYASAAGISSGWHGGH